MKVTKVVLPPPLPPARPFNGFQWIDVESDEDEEELIKIKTKFKMVTLPPYFPDSLFDEPLDFYDSSTNILEDLPLNLNLNPDE